MLNIGLAAQLGGELGNAAISNAFGGPALLAGDGAIPIAAGSYLITKGSAAALTIAAPTAADVGTRITVTSNTAFAHAVTFTGNTLQSGAAGVASLTCAAQKGAGFTIECVVAGFWNLIANVAQTIA